MSCSVIENRTFFFLYYAYGKGQCYHSKRNKMRYTCLMMLDTAMAQFF